MKLEDVLKAPIPPRYFFQNLEVGCYHVTHLKKSTQKRNLRIIQSYYEPSECRNDLKFTSNGFLEGMSMDVFIVAYIYIYIYIYI